MALADSIPGVSGGTIAFIMGFYDQLIQSVDDLIHGNKQERLKAIKFISKLAVGWGVGIILSVLFIASIFESHIYQISSLFLGLILAAIPLIIKQEKVVLKNNYVHVIFSLIGILVVVLISYFNPFVQSGSSVNLELTSNIQYLYILFAGMIAISAMILPGISGSTVLLILGLYQLIISSIDQFLRFNFTVLPILIFFGIGVLLGILITIRLVNYALIHYRSQTIHTIVGLMIGSLFAVVVGPMTIDPLMDPLRISNFSIIYFIFGGVLIFGLEYMRNKLEKN
ncbi:MAG: DUF368 domain-containing protein [Candidatus Izemoplasma sp.]|nr:DUF368 domain-containing protein [Candidatus Izemoplasma sp.]